MSPAVDGPSLTSSHARLLLLPTHNHRKAAGQSTAHVEESSDEEEEQEVEVKPQVIKEPAPKKMKIEGGKAKASSSENGGGLFGKVGDYFKSWWE